MPEENGTSKVLQEYVATKNANPDMPDNVLKAKFPEIGGFAAAKGVDDGVVMSNLNNYHDDYRSGNFSFEELNTKHNFFFPPTTGEVTTETVVETPEGVVSSTDQVQATTAEPTPSVLTNQVLQEYVATRNANPDFNEGAIQSKFPEIQAYADLKGIEPSVVMNDLNGYYDDYRSGDFTFDDLNAKYNFAEGLVKKKEDATQVSPSDSQLAGSTSELNVEGQDEFLNGLQQKDGEKFNFIPLGITEQDALGQFYSSTPSLNETFDQRIERNNLFVSEKRSEWSDKVTGEIPTLSFTEEAEALWPEVKTDLATTFGVSEDVVEENIGEWALQHSILDPEGTSFNNDPEQKKKMILRNQFANEELINNTKQKKQDLFNQSLELTGGDVDKATELFNKRGDQIGFNFLSENDLKVKQNKDQIAELRAKDDRTIDEDIKLKSLEKALQHNIEFGFAGEDLFDPATGQFISGNKKEEISPEVQEFNDRVQELSLQYEDTDVGTLRKIRDDNYIRYLTFKEFSDSQVEKLSTPEGEFKIRTAFGDEDTFNKTIEKYRKRERELLADFMASNRMLTLNEDPGTVAEESFFGAVAEGFKEGVGVVSESTSALADRGIGLLESAGVEITDEQRKKLDKSFTQKLGRTIGTSIPISVEIGANLFIGNKVAGLLKIPQLARVIANGNKVKQFGLTMLYETGLQGAAFAVSGESFSSGVGEGVGQTIASALLSRFGVKNKILNFGVRAISGAATETVAEFSGQFFEEMSENGFDMSQAAEETFGKTPDELIEKLALTYMTALVMGMGGASQQSNLFLEEAQKELKASGSKSPIVAAAIDMDVTTEFTEKEATELKGLRDKIENNEELSEEEFNKAELLETKRKVNDINSKNLQEESSPVVLVSDEKETAYKFKEGKSEGFVSEKELIKKLESDEFVDKVKTGKTELDITNPSPEVEQKMKEKFPESPEVEQMKLQFEEETTEAPAGEETKIEKDNTVTKPISETKKTETIQKSVESLNTVSDEISKVAEDVIPLSTPKVFDAVIDTAKNIAEETGLKGKELITELKTQLSEKLGESFDVEQINDISTEITEATKGIELKAEPVADVKKEKKISDTTNKIADKILSAKISISGLDQLSSSPKPLFDAAINATLEATAGTIRLGGNIAQAVADGIKILKESEWYKSLSQENKEKTEANISEQLKNIVESEQSKVSEVEEQVISKKETTETPKKKVTKKKPTPKKEPEVKKEAGTEKLNSKNKKFAERVDKQSTVSSDTKERILKESENVVSNQKELVKQSGKVFNDIMTETDGNYQEVIKLADRESVNADMREMLYGQVMQHLSELENSSDPTISKAASNDLVDLGIKTAERLNQAGKQIKAIGTIYKNFPMYALYSSVSRIETFSEKYNKKKGNPGEIKKEATQDVLDVISDIEQNLGEFLQEPEIAKRLEAIKQKMEKRPVRPTGLTDKRKAELKAKRKDILKKFKGQKKKDKLQSGIPFADQIVAVIEYAATLIEEGFYRSGDIVSNIKSAFKSVGVDLTDTQIKESLRNLQEFKDILESENVSTKKDSFGDTVSGAVGTYLKEGLKFSNMTMNEALVSSDKTKQQLKDDLIESLKNDFELDKKEAETVVKVIDQIFREKAAQKLKAGFNKFYSPLSIKKATATSKADKLANDVALGAFDTTLAFMDLTFQKHGMVNTNNPELITKLREISDKMRNAPDGVLKDRHRKNLETLIHQETNGYGFMDWIMTRFYGSILSGPIIHAKNLKYNTFAIGIAGPVSQMYLKGANPIRTYKEMLRSFYQVDRKVASHYMKTGDNFVDPGLGPKTFADQSQFNLIKNGFTKLLNVASTRSLVASDLIMTRPFAAAVFKNHVKSWLRTTEGLKGKDLEVKATEMMGYTQENVDKSSKEALEDVKADYGFDPFAEDITGSVQREASMLLLLRTQERILENSGIEEKIGTENWLDAWNGESLAESSETEAKKLALQGEVNGTVGIFSDLMERATSYVPALKFKIPFVRILGNMLNTGIKWTPGLGQFQAVARYTINKTLAKKGMQTTSSSTLWALEKFQEKSGIKLFKEGVLEGFNKEASQRHSLRDFRNAFFITGVQLMISQLLAKDDDDEGLVITGMLDKSFFKRDSIEKGTGISPFTVYWRNADGKMTEISEYKNSATGFAFAFFGSWDDTKRTPGITTTRLFLDAMASSPFYIAEKPAFTSLKETFDLLNPVDKYGNNKWLDDVGYKDRVELGISKFINSMLVPNLFKQTEKITEQVYGGERTRTTNWWQEIIKGVPFTDQVGKETQFDHFGRPLENKFELGFLGLKGNAEDGFTFLEPEKVDPYYEVYTDHGQTPKWFTDKEIPVYQPDENGVWEKSVIQEEGEKNETGKIRISKYEGHILNALIGQYRKEGIDNTVNPRIENGVVVYTTGIDALNEMSNKEFDSERRKIDKEAKERAFIEFFENYYGDDIKLSNKEKGGTYLKVQ